MYAFKQKYFDNFMLPIVLEKREKGYKKTVTRENA